MAIILRVSLDKTYTPWAVDVDETGEPNRINPANIRRLIRWELVGNAATGKFHPQQEPEPGFRWLQPTPDGVFGEPMPSGDFKQVSISDLNNSQQSKGTFIYQLWIEVDGVSYSTIAELGMRAATNPAIINR